MSFKTYDILSSLIPGFMILVPLLNSLGIEFNSALIIPYTAFAFFLGYLVNTIGSWLEGIYFISWGGKPSDKLLNGNGIWKVKFYHSSEVRSILLKESKKQNPSNGELFSIAMRLANGNKESRADDFNALYAFSRSLLTAIILATLILLWKYYYEIRFYPVSISIFFIVWLRTKQRAYYYAREVLNFYLKSKS